jgi:hypothetical protein
VLVLGLYAKGLTGGFLFDDFPNLVLDPSWKLMALTWDQIMRALQGGIASLTGRPLAILSFAANHWLTGEDPFWLKQTNVLMHAGNAVLVWMLVRRLFARLDADANRAGAFLAFLIAAAWALHPLQVSTVLYVVQRMEIGAATGILLSLLCYLRLRDRQLAGQRAWPWALAMLAAVALGAGFKETALLVPGYAFLIEACLYRFRNAKSGLSRLWITTYASSAVLAALALAWLARPLLHFDPTTSARNFTPYQRLLTQGPVLAMYLGQILLPRLDSLRFYYDNLPVSSGLLSPPSTLAAWLLMIGLAGGAVLAWRRWPLTALGIGWFLLGHALTSNVLMLELAFEHRNYLPLLGIALAVVQPLQSAGRRLHGDAKVVLTLLPVLALACLCLIEAATWGNPTKLDWTLENRNPTSPRASYALGARLLRNADGDSSTTTWSMAHAQLEAASRLAEAPPLALQALLIMDGRAGHAIPQGQWQRFASQLTARSISAEGSGALYAVTQCRIDGGCTFNDGELLAVYLQVLQRNPYDATLLTQYANFAWNVLQDRPLAIQAARAAVTLSPTVAYQIALAKFLLADGQVQEGHALVATLERQPGDIPQNELNALKALEAPFSSPPPTEQEPQ